MTFDIGWEFIREFHPLPNSDRRLLLKALNIDNVPSREDELFYGWLAERYRAGEGPLIDQAIRQSSNKPEDRCLDAMLRQWLIVRTGRSRHRSRANSRTQIRAMLEGLDPTSVIARQIDLILPNFPWLHEERAGRPVAQSKNVDLDLDLPSEEPPLPPAADHSPSPSDVLDRLAAALEAMREDPEPTLVEWAGALADAIEAHLTALSRAEEDAAALAERRAALKVMLAGADSVIAGRLGTVPVDILTIEMVDRLENALANLNAANAALSRAQEAWRLAATAGKAERDSATAEVDRTEMERDDVLDRFSQELADCIASLEQSSGYGKLKLSAPELSNTLLVEPDTISASDAEPGFSGVEDNEDRIAQGDDSAAHAVLQSPNTISDPEPEQQAEIREALSYENRQAEQVHEVLFSDDATGQDPDLVAQEEPDGPNAPDPHLPRWDEWIAQALEGKRYGLAVHLLIPREAAPAFRNEAVPLFRELLAP